MLQELSISKDTRQYRWNTNIISTWDYVVLTGAETGADKSIIDALGLLAGGRGSTEFILRKGEKKLLFSYSGYLHLPRGS